MSHTLRVEDLFLKQIIHMALAKEEGFFLNQNYPKTPPGMFWTGGILFEKTKNSLKIDLKPFLDLSKINLDHAFNGNILTIPHENIEKIVSFSGDVWILLKS